MHSELHLLMDALSLKGSRALAAVAEVGHEVAGDWLSGNEPVPSEIVVMLRGLAAMHCGMRRS